MQRIFSSPLFIDKAAQLPKKSLQQHLRHARYALAHHLSSIIPYGSVVAVYHAKDTLADILPEVAKERNCTVIAIEPGKRAQRAFHDAGILSDTGHADIILTEPAGFTKGGALVAPPETKELEGKNVIGVGSILQWTTESPAHYDFVPLTYIVTEIGAHTPEQLYEEITSSA